MSVSFQARQDATPSSAARSLPRWAGLARFCAIVVTLHAPSWLMAWLFHAPRADERPMFNLDLLVAAALACVSALVGCLALVLAWAADLIRAAAKNYHFMSALDFVEAVRFFDMLNMRAFLSAPLLGMVIAFAACVWLVLRLTHRRRKLAWPLLGLAVFAMCCDIANGSFHIFALDKDRRISNVNVAGSPAWNVLRDERQRLLASGLPAPMRNPVSFRALRDWQTAHPGQTSMLVLVESMGLPRHPALQAWLKHQMATPRLLGRWTIQSSDEEFIGATTAGELRALCGLHGHYSRVDDALASMCLPHQLMAKGVTSLGIHGFGLRMFDRADWWPRIGLKPWHWQESGAVVEMNCNRAFPGVCDSAVLEQAVKQAQVPGRFVYALTLDTHLPLDLRHATPLPAELQAACTASATPALPCQFVHKLGDLLARLESRLVASEATPFLVVVGDHAPPFAEAVNREVFVPDRVPMFVLEPVVRH